MCLSRVTWKMLDNFFACTQDIFSTLMLSCSPHGWKIVRSSQTKAIKVFLTFTSLSLMLLLTTVLPVLFKYCYKYCYSDSRKL